MSRSNNDIEEVAPGAPSPESFPSDPLCLASAEVVRERGKEPPESTRTTPRVRTWLREGMLAWRFRELSSGIALRLPLPWLVWRGKGATETCLRDAQTTIL